MIDKTENLTKETTLARYEELLDRINPVIGHLQLKEITAKHLSDFYVSLSMPGANKRTGKGLSPKTIREHHMLISAILNRACLYRLIDSNPALIARESLPSIKKPEMEIFSKEELKEILSLADGESIKWKTIINILAFMGLRRGELLGLRWTDLELDSDSPIMRIRNNVLYTTNKGVYTDTPKSKDSNRSLRIPGELASLLEEYRGWSLSEEEKYGDAYHPSEYLFTSVLGDHMHPDSVTDYLRKFQKRHNLPYHINPHKFRHTVASILIYKGIDIVTVSAFLGHSDPSITARIYAHLIKDAMARAHDAISEVLLE